MCSVVILSHFHNLFQPKEENVQNQYETVLCILYNHKMSNTASMPTLLLVVNVDLQEIKLPYDAWQMVHGPRIIQYAHVRL